VVKRRVNKYPKAFRLMAVERMKTCDNILALAKELGVDRSVLYTWRDLMPGQGSDGFTINSPVRELRRKIRGRNRY
jgi:transposase-like protein